MQEIMVIAFLFFSTLSNISALCLKFHLERSFNCNCHMFKLDDSNPVFFLLGVIVRAEEKCIKKEPPACLEMLTSVQNMLIPVPVKYSASVCGSVTFYFIFCKKMIFYSFFTHLLFNFFNDLRKKPLW